MYSPQFIEHLHDCFSLARLLLCTMFAPLYGGNAWFAPPNDICLQCMRFPKRKNFTFCSKGCSDAVARDAPRLIKIPPNHVMHQNGTLRASSVACGVTIVSISAVKRDFESSWCAPNRPCILDIYLITWSASSRSSFDNYRYVRFILISLGSAHS